MSPVATGFLKGQTSETPARIQGINPHGLQTDIHLLVSQQINKVRDHL